MRSQLSLVSLTYYFEKIFSMRNFLISPENAITIKGSSADEIIGHVE